MYYPLTVADLPTPERTGYTFAGWYTNAAFLGNPVTQVVMDRDRVVYAKWEENIYYDKVRLILALYNNNAEMQKVIDNQPYYYVRVDDRGQEITTTAFKVDGFRVGQRTYYFDEIEMPRGKYILKANSGYTLGQINANTRVQTKITLETSPTQIQRTYYDVICYDPADKYSVLYYNGQLVINEPIEDRASNTANYGGVMRQYAALTAANGYVPEWDPGCSVRTLNARDGGSFKAGGLAVIEVVIAWNDENAYALRIKKARFGSPVKPTTMKKWFNGCRNLTEINTYGLDTSECTNLEATFQNCIKLETCDISAWDTNQVINMSGTFNNCRAWLTLNVDHFDTRHCTDFSACFGGLQIEEFAPKIDTSAAERMASMFGYSTTKILDLRTFDTHNVIEYAHMFTSCTELETIIVGDDFEIAAGANTTEMFLQCYSIIGGSGTVYNASQIDGAMAHIDTAADPGYFTGI